MTLDFWFCNTKPDEKEATLRLLIEQDACDVKETPSADGTDFTGTLCCDSDADMVRAVVVMAFYNNRTEDLSALADDFRALLIKYPSKPFLT